VPKDYWGKFDVIYDGGTAEHVFHFPQVLKNIHLMLKENGVIIHVSPSHNHVDHGFYMFSPQVYYEYYHTNRYAIKTSQVFEYSPRYNDPWTVYHYQPGALDRLAYGGFGSKMLAIHLVAQKTADSTSCVIPQQGGYVTAWKAEHKTSSSPKRKVNPIKRLGISLYKKMRRHAPGPLKRFVNKRALNLIGKY
jgi:SAM-dependent methyltransferase